jgi:hypothetical protein
MKYLRSIKNNRGDSNIVKDFDISKTRIELEDKRCRAAKKD